MLSNAEGCALCDPPWEANPPEFKESCHEYEEDSFFSWAGLGGQQPPLWGSQEVQPPVLDSIVTDSVQALHYSYFTLKFPFYALPCCQGQDCH